MAMFEDYRRQQLEKEAPLAARMRPRSFEEFMGQEHIVGQGGEALQAHLRRGGGTILSTPRAGAAIPRF